MTVAPASAAPEGNQIIEIRSVAHDLCLDIAAQGRTGPSLATCTRGATQQFERIVAAAGGAFLHSMADGYCPDRLRPGWRLYGFQYNAEAVDQRIELAPLTRQRDGGDVRWL